MTHVEAFPTLAEGGRGHSRGPAEGPAPVLPLCGRRPCQPSPGWGAALCEGRPSVGVPPAPHSFIVPLPGCDTRVASCKHFSFGHGRGLTSPLKIPEGGARRGHFPSDSGPLPLHSLQEPMSCTAVSSDLAVPTGPLSITHCGSPVSSDLAVPPAPAPRSSSHAAAVTDRPPLQMTSGPCHQRLWAPWWPSPPC